MVTFGEVATHNHFALDRGGKVFNRTAPIIKLSASASENDHLGLLGLLNSSVACFWLKQVCHGKGLRGIGGGITAEAWEQFIQINGTRLEAFPLSAQRPLDLARALDTAAERLSANLPDILCTRTVPTREALDAARVEAEATRACMVALQEELDWRCYHLYGLLEDALQHRDPPPLRFGERPFEIILARRIAAGELETAWFERHQSTPIAELPAQWPADYRAVVERRIALIESHATIGLIERPEYKRRWSAPTWEEVERDALRAWLLDRLTAKAYAGRMTAGIEAEDVQKAANSLIAAEAKQRKQAEVGDIPVPPKYKTADFQSQPFWRLRGGLDVPKERFVSFPHGARDADPSLPVLWAGHDHLARARAIAAWYVERRETDGWPAERLKPLLAGLLELVPGSASGTMISIPKRGCAWVTSSSAMSRSRRANSA